MILTALIVGCAIAGLLAAFWKDLVGFLQAAIDKVKQIVNGILYGSKVFIKKLGEAVKEISRHYSKVDGHWQETTVTKQIPESEVPKDILERAGYNTELDITNELEMQLESA